MCAYAVTSLLISTVSQVSCISAEQSRAFAAVSVAFCPEVSVRSAVICRFHLPSLPRKSMIYSCVFLFLRSKEISRTEINRD